jgi:hypothetical protein
MAAIRHKAGKESVESISVIESTVGTPRATSAPSDRYKARAPASKSGGTLKGS